MLRLLSRVLFAVNLVMAQDAEQDEFALKKAEELLAAAVAAGEDMQAQAAALEKLAQAMGGDSIAAIMAAAEMEKKLAAEAASDGKTEEPEKYPEFEELIGAHGYTWEPYKLVTEDGYHLVMFRITGKVGSEADAGSRKPVILGHGKYMDSTSWFKSGGVPLPIQLYEAGFDVWLSNARGTKYC